MIGAGVQGPNAEMAGLPALVHFLSELHWTGRLRVHQDAASGEVVFDAGAVTDATLGTRSGLAALEGLFDLFPEAGFGFSFEPLAADAPQIEADGGDDDAAEVAADRCPKLGFQDDPLSSFGRPTRLHRCFAAGAPMPLSMDQQRELCLSDQFSTCPRLSAPEPETSERPRATLLGARRARDGNGDDPRIVRLAFGTAPDSPPEPVREADRGPAPEPTLLRARPERSAAAPSPSLEQPPEGRAAPPPPHERVAAALRMDDPFADGRRPLLTRAVSMGAVCGAVLLLAAIAYVLVPQLFGDSVDATSLPNARLAEQGTPVAALAPPRATPLAVASAAPGAGTPVPAANVASGAAAAAVPGASVAPGASAVAPAASVAPVAGVQASASGQAGAAPSSPGATLLDERFTTNDANWPSSSQGLSLWTDGGYRIATRKAGEFAAIGAPLSSVPANVQITADFRKLGGPEGGGYGIIVRDQSPGIRDGSSQDGHYYVLEAGDKGEIGIWRRDGDHWVDLLPWQPSDAVQTGTAPNELTVRAVGDTLSLSINGTQVASKKDAALADGQVGIFVGGDGNQVAVSRFTVQAR